MSEQSLGEGIIQTRWPEWKMVEVPDPHSGETVTVAVPELELFVTLDPANADTPQSPPED
jgi:hypothetical protein